MTRTAGRWLARLLYGVVAASSQVGAQGEQPAEAAHVFTLPAGWRFVGTPVAIQKPVPGSDRPWPSDRFAAVVQGTPDSQASEATAAAERVGVAAIRFDPDGAGRIAWTTWLGDAGTDVHIGGGRDVTGDGDVEVLACISPRQDYHFLDGKFLVLSASDGAIHGTTSVSTRGLMLGSGIAEVGEAGSGSTRFLITATDSAAPSKLIDFDIASSVAQVVPLAVDGASMVLGVAWLGQQNGRADALIALQTWDKEATSRVVAIDLGTHEQRTLYQGRRSAGMCRAVELGGQWTDDVMIAEVREEVLPQECVWLELRRVSSRTAKVLSTSTFQLNDKLGAGLMASWVGASIDAWDDMDGDGTRDYVCSIAGTCPQDVWRLLLVSGATGALLGRIDDVMLARHLGPDGPRDIAPYFGVPLRMTPESTPAIGIGLGGDLNVGSSAVAVLDLTECLRAR